MIRLSIFLGLFGIMATLFSCKPSAPPTEKCTLSVGMPEEQAMKCLEANFDNIHLQQGLVGISEDGKFSSSIDATGLDWNHKSGRFCVELLWRNGKLDHIDFGTDAEYKKPFGLRTFHSVKRLTFSKDGNEICLEMEP